MNLVWVDIETTGLNEQTATILEIAVLLTDQQLKPLGEGVNLIIHHPQEVLEGMNTWCQQQHGKSGLTEQVKNSSLSMSAAEEKILSLIKQHVPEKSSPLCGNTVHFDKRFLKHHMPKVHDYLHKRIIDVSTIKELAKRWYPELPEYTKKETHRALEDIKESIEELQYYKEKIFT